MRRNNTSNFKRYEDQLSPFGRQVLSNLIKQRNKQREYDFHRPRFESHQIHQRHYKSIDKTVVTFKDPRTHSTPSALLEAPPLIDDVLGFPNDVISAAAPIEFNYANNVAESSIPKSIELVRTIDSRHDEDYDIPCDLIINPVFNGNENLGRNIKNNIFHATNFNNKERMVESENILDKNTTNNPMPVSWDNMFDSEIFSDICASSLDCRPKDTIDTDPYKIQYPTVSKDNTSHNVNKTKNKLSKNENKQVKRKIQTKITDTASKKVKKAVTETVNNTKNDYRKHSYRKSVKAWLNDIEPENAEEVVLDINNLENEPNENKYSPIPGPLVNIEITTPQKPNKKVVQAQLANKDGVMKFKIPLNAVNNDSREFSKTDCNKKIEKGMVKEKIAKPKFVAPLKSQVPIKDIVYEVHVLDSKNKEEHELSFQDISNKEVIMILVYSNGFCQLNKQHTEGDCIPEGIIINIDEMYYYIRGDAQYYEILLFQLLKNNFILCYEGKHALLYIMSQFGIQLDGEWKFIDAKVGGSLLDPDNQPENFSELQKLVLFTPQFTIATECVLQKSAWYMAMLRECIEILKSLLIEHSLWNVFVKTEMPLIPIIANMEHRGVCVDMEKLKSMECTLITRMKHVEQQCYEAAGKSFQINSTVQVRRILYDELQLDTKSKVTIRETVTLGAKSTSETMLRNLMSVHPLPKLILEYRHLHKAYATFLTGIAQHVKNGVVRATWVQNAAATGRIASNNPNLQAIPKVPFSLSMFPVGDDKDDQQVLCFRSLYTAREGHSFLAADFKHIECRVFAYASSDGDLLKGLSSGGDIFVILAAKWLNKPESEISSEDRERTKRIVYASLYGAGARKLMDILDISYERALEVIASFNRTFPSLRGFGRAVVSECLKNDGWARTLGGRARRFSDVTSTDTASRSRAERQAVNFVVQGSAADVCKTAMSATREALSAVGLHAHLVLQIHDELVWEVLDDSFQQVASVIKSAMEECGCSCGMPISLPVSLSRGRTWGDMVEYISNTTI